MGVSQFVQANIDYAAVAPMLIVFGGAMVGVLVEAFVPRRLRYAVEVPLTLAVIVASFLFLVLSSVHHRTITAGGAVVTDGMALFIQGTLLLMTLLTVLTMAERFGGPEADTFTQAGASIPGSELEAEATRLGGTTTEVFPLTLFSLVGMMMFPASGNLLIMFVALEVLSLPLYILTGLARRRRLLSQEAAMKYFLLGAFSSAFFLFGSALIYGFANSVNFSDISTAITTVDGKDAILVAGIILIAVGLLFKVSAVPFHSWAPDVYQGAPTPISGFMASATKIAAFGAILRVFYSGFEAMRWSWQPVIAIVALITMVVGAVLTVTQTDMKRLIAYSSISHAGFILLGVVAMDRSSVAGVMFYLVCYGLTTIAAFALVALVRSGGVEANHLSQWAGVAKTSPVLAAAMTFLLASFAGIPITSGFTSKFALFLPAVNHGAAWLVVIAMIMSAVTAFAYFKVVVLMYFSKPVDGVSVVVPSLLTGLAVTVGTVLTLVLGVVPAPLLDLANNSALLLR